MGNPAENVLTKIGNKVMGLEYTNRRGDRYYVFQGQTKTGKPKYYCARKASESGTPVERLPDDYEIYERPDNVLVSIRKIRPSQIQPFEREQLTQWADKLARTPVMVDVDGDYMIVYAADTNPDASIRAMHLIFGECIGGEDKQREWVLQHTRYSAMFRFTLKDEDKRLYSIERWCFRGSVDRWIHLDNGIPLEDLAKTYLPHLGHESFYELMAGHL